MAPLEGEISQPDYDRRAAEGQHEGQRYPPIVRLARYQRREGGHKHRSHIPQQFGYGHLGHRERAKKEYPVHRDEGPHGQKRPDRPPLQAAQVSHLPGKEQVDQDSRCGERHPPEHEHER